MFDGNFWMANLRPQKITARTSIDGQRFACAPYVMVAYDNGVQRSLMPTIIGARYVYACICIVMHIFTIIVCTFMISIHF